MRAANMLKDDSFDIKHSVGGIIDVEFLVQYLVLNCANKNHQLADNKGNIELLRRLGSLKIIDKDLATKTTIAYREYRRLQHALKLQGATQMHVNAQLVGEHIAAVSALWHQVLLK
jgi:[glutamine synthetase] adenylyltransferase / [glutamine synthetase]-adenylyl-L-tyrosine phosphorylase